MATSTSKTAVNTKTGKTNAQVLKESNAVVAKAKAMLAQTKAEGSKSFKGSSYEKDYKAGKFDPIPVDTKTPASPVPIPEPPKPTTPVTPFDQMNAALAPGLSDVSTYDFTTNTWGTAENPEAGMQANLKGYIDSVMGLEQPNNEATLAQLEKEAGLKRKQQLVSSLTGQLNTIQNSAQTQQLALENQGRGITTDILDTQAYEISRRAAIAALPVQAQLAAAQGDLQMAQEHVDKMFQIKMQDAQNQYQFKLGLINTVYDYANNAEKRRLDQLAVDKKMAHDDRMTALSQAQQWASQAIEYGQASLASQFMALDPSSPTFQTDLARLSGRLAKPAPITKRDTQFDSAGNLIDMQTGEVIRTNTSGSKTLDGKPQTADQAKAQSFATRLHESDAVITKLGDAFSNWYNYGSVLPNFAQSEDRQKFEQAKRNFINAQLRRESGAVISDSEFKNADKQYFPQPGDSLGVLEQKKQNRDSAITNLYREANIEAPTLNAKTTAAKDGDTYVWNGVTYKVVGNQWVAQ